MTKVVAVIGPTASGKTELAVEIAKRFGGEVVSADSMQIYKYMDIATAKPTIEEMQGVPHHLIDFVEPDEKFSVANYVRLAHAAIDDIVKRDRLPVIAGGTGLYIDSLMQNISFSPQENDEVLRKELNEMAAEKGVDYMLEMLREIDPDTAARLHPNNIGRIIRAIELYKITGVTMSEQLERSHGEKIYDPLFIGLDFKNRDMLYERINLRVDRMLEMGLLDEMHAMEQHGFSDTACQAIGYKELSGWRRGEMSFDDAVEALKRSTRRYAKRQLTWFRRNPDVHWLFRDDYSNIMVLKNAAFDLVENFYGNGSVLSESTEN